MTVSSASLGTGSATLGQIILDGPDTVSVSEGVFVVTLEGYTPLERADGVPWTVALIQESSGPDPAGTWTTIETITLSPIDADPANPAVRDLTTTHATLAEGWYRVIWQDSAGGQSTGTSPVQNLSELAGGLRPSVREVASRLRARTKITGGAEAGTFTAATRPTADEVEDLIDDALDEVLGKVQPTDPSLPQWAQQGDAFNAPGSPYERRVRRAVALYAAILVELSYFPEQVKNDQSPVATFQTLYESRIRALIAEGETGRPEGEGAGSGSGGSDAPADAFWTFPSTGPGALVGYNSRW